jgi:hypothetical protein
MRTFIIYSSPNIIRVIKSRMMGQVRHVALTERRGACKILVRKLKGRDMLEI